MKKITIVGRGTVGCAAAAHYSKHHEEDTIIDWVYDPSIPTTAVGEGTTLMLPDLLNKALEFDTNDLNNLDSIPKMGILKNGWTDKEYFHSFPTGMAAMHFNAISFQDYIFDILKDKSNINLIESNVDLDKLHDIDSDLVMSCVGSPKQVGESKFTIRDNIVVNACYVSQCPWDFSRFNWSLTHAKKHGWIFGIPLQNRVAIGYLFNKDITPLEDIKEEVDQILNELNLEPKVQRLIEFNNYNRKINFEDDGRIVHNGNASYFLEPLEATSTSVACDIILMSNFIFNNQHLRKDIAKDYNNFYTEMMDEHENMIMMHYLAGSIHDTPFWDFAQEKAKRSIRAAFKKDNEFAKIVKHCLNGKYEKYQHWDRSVGSWDVKSYFTNIKGLQIEDKLRKLMI
jgi:hypothetical protein